MTGDSVVRVIAPSGKEATFFMDNVWISYEHDKENRRDLLERYMSTAAGFDKPAAGLSREQVIAIVKDSNYMSMFKPERQVARRTPVWRFVDCLRGRSARTEPVASRRIACKAHRHSRRTNCSIWQKTTSAESYRLHSATETVRLVHLVTAGGDYTASLLLFDGLWDDLSPSDSVEGDVVAVAPSRDVLLYTGSESKGRVSQRSGSVLLRFWPQGTT